MYSRRAVLAGMGAGSVVLLAGCSGVRDGGGGDGAGDGPEPRPGEMNDGGSSASAGDLFGLTPTRLTLPEESGDGSDSRLGLGAGALSADGTIALLGEPWVNIDNIQNKYETYPGAAYVYEYDGTSWRSTAVLRASDGDGADGFGGAVALSADGRVAIVGAHDDEHPNGEQAVGTHGGFWGAGSAYVFERVGDGWAEQAKLVASDGIGGDRFGRCVALSADGQTAAVAAEAASLYQDRPRDVPREQLRLGSVYVFERDGDAWTESAKLTRPGSDRFVQVALSADGNTIVAVDSGRTVDGRWGSGVYVFGRDGDSWSKEADMGHFGPTRNYSGYAADVSATGSLLFVGDYADRTDGEPGGAMYVFERADDEWSHLTRFASEDEENRGSEFFGQSVAISDDGSRLLVVASGDTNPDTDATGAGSVTLLERSGDTWRRRERVFAPDDVIFRHGAISADGRSALVSGRERSSDTGVAYVYGPTPA